MRRRGFLFLCGAAALVPRGALASRVEDIAKAVGGARYIAIGERHDNPDHHVMQAELVAALAPAGLAFEMIPQAEETAVNAMRAEGATAAELESHLAEAAPGWDWPVYTAIMAAAPGAYVAGGGLSKEALRAVYTDGAAGIGASLAERYGLDESLPEALREEMLEEQYSAHCEMIEREKLGAMVEVQRAWDAAYAEAWWRAREKGGGRSVLICGNAHARLDRGAPSYLAKAVPEARIAAIGMLEGEETAPGGFTATLSAPVPEREDPCERMREAMGKKE